MEKWPWGRHLTQFSSQPVVIIESIYLNAWFDILGNTLIFALCQRVK